MTIEWSYLPAHGSVCLAYAPEWYVPLLAVLLLITVGSYGAIAAVLIQHALHRRLRMAREMAWMYGAFVASCGIAHAVAAVTLYVGGAAYLWLLGVTAVMAATSLSAAVATLILRSRANAIGAHIDRVAMGQQLRRR